MIKYKGVQCTLHEHYFADDDGPYLKITSPHDIERAYKLGFECMGCPDEVMKKITREEYNSLKNAAIK